MYEGEGHLGSLSKHTAGRSTARLLEDLVGR